MDKKLKKTMFKIRKATENDTPIIFDLIKNCP